MELVFAQLDRFDVLHFHTDWIHFPILHRQPWPSVTTLHGALNRADHGGLLRTYRDLPLVSISNAQRRGYDDARWVATVHHGLPRELHRPRGSPGRYLAFLGRTSPEKGLERAIAVARAADLPLRIAARTYPEERAYFVDRIEPLLRDAGRSIEFVGEIGGPAKDEFLGGAAALLFPIDWEEPFGLVMIEAMACGTPVVAWRRGSVPEVVDDGVTGFVVDDVEAAVRAVGRIGTLDREACRRTFERRFDARRMARDYVEVYTRVIERHGRAT
jgi:glycosyltransferase involved in cell wall biosynthesis